MIALDIKDRIAQCRGLSGTGAFIWPLYVLFITSINITALRLVNPKNPATTSHITLTISEIPIESLNLPRYGTLSAKWVKSSAF